MAGKTYHVEAIWDPEAQVWVATSEDVPGLATEAASLEQLTAKLRIMIPELLEANHAVPSPGSGIEPPEILAFELVTRRHEEVRLAS